MNIIYFLGELTIDEPNMWIKKEIFNEDHNINCIVEPNKYPILFDYDRSLSNNINAKKNVFGKLLIWEEGQPFPTLNKAYNLTWSNENIHLGKIVFNEID